MIRRTLLMSALIGLLPVRASVGKDAIGLSSPSNVTQGLHT